MRELDAIPSMSERYWFWTGNGKLQTAVADCRDTFAVELLLAGVPLERVSILLGHPSLKITEKHYSPWIRKRQGQAEADVRRTWVQDPIALLEPIPPMKGTPEVRENARPSTD